MTFHEMFFLGMNEFAIFALTDPLVSRFSIMDHSSFRIRTDRPPLCDLICWEERVDVGDKHY